MLLSVRIVMLAELVREIGELLVLLGGCDEMTVHVPIGSGCGHSEIRNGTRWLRNSKRYALVRKLTKRLREGIMSWDQYLDNLVAQSRDSTGANHVDKACIVGIDGGARWTSDSHAHGMKVIKNGT